MDSKDDPLLYEIFPWNSNFEVGISFIDEQHQKLVHLVNKAIWLLVSGNNDNEAVLNDLLEYAHYHFDQEEILWQKYFGTTEHADNHAHSHNLFFTKVIEITTPTKNYTPSTDKLIEYLTNWIAVHILQSDRQLAMIVLEIDQNGTSFPEAEKIVKHKIKNVPVVQSSLVDLYRKLSKSAAQLIRENVARTQAETKIQILLEEKAKNDLEVQAKEYQDHLEFIAFHDPQTGLLNSNGFLKELRVMMRLASKEARPISVISINLDYFGQISSQLGSEGTSRLLGVLAKRWQDALRPNGILAHIGSDDFVVLVKNSELMSDQLDAFYLAASQPFNIDEWKSGIEFTAGVCVYPQEFNIKGMDAEKLLRQADYALIQAKLDTRGSYCEYDVKEERIRHLRNEQISEIRIGLKDNQFVLYYQPKVDMRSGDLIGAEALIRWQHPKTGLLAPDNFLPALEHHPLIIDLGEWVIETAIQQMLVWERQGIKLKVSVNVDAMQIQHKQFPETLNNILNKYPEFDPVHLDIEILETVAIKDMETVIDNINQCKKYGVSFSLDDFGKGYCSLSYLKQLPVNTLKIDQVFVRNMLEDASNISILVGIIAIAKTFDLKVIAEGVESVMHGEFLIQIGCELAQGYCIARPMPADSLNDWLKQWKTFGQWQKSHVLRRDDIVALTGLAEINEWLKKIEQSENSSSLPSIEHSFHSKNMEKWIKTSLDNRPISYIDTVNKIQSNYNKLLVLGKESIEQSTGSSLESSDTLKVLTEQIRLGLQDCLKSRNTTGKKRS